MADSDSFVNLEVLHLSEEEAETSTRRSKRKTTRKSQVTPKRQKTSKLDDDEDLEATASRSQASSGKSKKYQLTDDQRRRYNARTEEKRRQRLANETLEEREARLSARRVWLRQYSAQRLANETPEQREKRLLSARNAMARKRLRKKLKTINVMDDLGPETSQDGTSGAGKPSETGDSEDESGWWHESGPVDDTMDSEASLESAAGVETKKEDVGDLEEALTQGKKSTETRRIYQTRFKIKCEAKAMCYFCLSAIDEAFTDVSDLKKKLEASGKPVLSHNLVPEQACVTCWKQVLSALDTFEMVSRAHRFWETILVKVDTNHKPKNAPSDPKPQVQTLPSPEEARRPEILDESEGILQDLDTAEYNFLCRICHSGFQTKIEIRRHALVAHALAESRIIGSMCASHRTLKETSQPYCVKCWEEFESEEQLSLHKPQCFVPLKDQNFTPGWLKPWNCEVCGKRYGTKAQLNYHLKTTCYRGSLPSQEAAIYRCDLCNGKEYTTHQALRQHIDKIHSEKRETFVCDKCGRSFYVEKSLELHRLRCDPTKLPRPAPVKNFVCTICERRFVIKPQLELHINRVHTKRKAFFCRFCDKGFFGDTARLTHEARVHAKSRTCRCKKCGKEWFRLYDIKIHALHDYGILPDSPEFETEVLERISGQEKIQRQRDINSRFQCDQCGQGFPTEKILQTHRGNGCQPMNLPPIGQSEKFIRHTCEKCLRWFKSFERLQTHYSKGCDLDEPPLAVLYPRKDKTGIEVETLDL